MSSIILNYLNINIPTDSDETVKFAFIILTLSLVSIVNLINIIGYLISTNLIYGYNIEGKISNIYFKRLFNYFKRFTLYFIVVESLLCFIPLLMIAIGSYFEIYKYLN